MRAILAAAVALASVAACDKSGPTGPTPPGPYGVTPRVAIPKTILPVESQFQDSIWREIAFDEYDEPGQTTNRITWPLSTASPNLYIRMGDPILRQVVPYELLDWMRGAFPRMVEDITGKTWNGEIRDGLADYEASGWITVRFVEAEEEPDIAKDDVCGRASVGADRGNIWIVRRDNCVAHPGFRGLFAHEVGHALGLFHVSDPSALMHPRGGYALTARERYHARLLYRVGRGKRCCGWPFGPDC